MNVAMVYRGMTAGGVTSFGLSDRHRLEAQLALSENHREPGMNPAYEKKEMEHQEIERDRALRSRPALETDPSDHRLDRGKDGAAPSPEPSALAFVRARN